VERRIPCLTSLDTARSLVDALEQTRGRAGWTVAAISDYVAGLVEVAR
jgi:hypothetical protein